MATIVLSAAGMALGGSLGGSVLGMSSAVLGRAAGAMLGRAIDERLLGAGSAPVEQGRVDRFRLTGASEGAPIPRVFGAVRVAGQVIWATRFKETATTQGGGKGGGQPEVTTYSYSISLAIALCEGEIAGVGRVWADGQEIARHRLGMSVYTGSATQLPDPRMEAVEGAGKVPAFRGLAYVVLEDLALARFGNRVPQLSFEVFRPAAQAPDAGAEDLGRLIRSVCLIPGTGEYALATEPVHVPSGWGRRRAANLSTSQRRPDLLVSLDDMARQLPRLESVGLVVSWFGSDLRCGACQVRPKVETATGDGEGMPWVVSGVSRGAAQVLPQHEGGAVYGGTPCDESVRQAIQAIHARGKGVTFYPFLLMDQLGGNALPDPYGGAEQPRLPWRGRITGSVAPGLPGSPDGTAAADAQVAAFFGAAQPGHFSASGQTVAYSGPAEWSWRRMILHYAKLCASAGGVEAFCIGSELRGLTTLRGAAGYPAVQALKTLAQQVKAILPGATVTYAADWSEYHGHQPPGTADKHFHLDPLWSDPAVGAVAIDNYMPLSDWRDGDAHLDAAVARDIHDVGYLAANVAGGELFDWFYASDADRLAQVRTPITDGLASEPWVWRAKDLKGWWSNPHHDRVGGVRSATPTAWVPRSKPIWFTEMGCAAIDKGTNEPNKFLDPKSSESSLPAFSDGRRDDLIAQSYYRAVFRHFADPANNPVSSAYGAPMVDMDRAHAWAWDARPFPAFPARSDLWGDAANYHRGHWLQGRVSARSLASVVRELCADCGAVEPDTTDLHGLVRGMLLDEAGTAREALQPLLLAHGVDVAERDGALVFRNRRGLPQATLTPDDLALEGDAALTLTRAPEAELVGRVQLHVLEHGAAYASVSAEAVLPDDAVPSLSRNALPLVMLRDEARGLAERWLHESRVARDGARFALPPSLAHLGAGDVVALAGAAWRIDRVEDTGPRLIEASRVEDGLWRAAATEPEDGAPPAIGDEAPVEAVFLDLPMLSGDEAPHAPRVAFAGDPWPGQVTLLASDSDAAYALALEQVRPAVAGTTLTPMSRAEPGLWDRGPALRVEMVSGALESVGPERVLAGAGAMAIGDGESEHWEVFQFAEATLVAPLTWDLSLRLRGQAGTDGVMPDGWPAGSRVVLLDGAVAPWAYPPALRDRLRHYRWGPSGKPASDPTWRHREVAFRGVGLRPYSVCHLRAASGAGGLALAWTRRSRIEGDSWVPSEIPLGEDREAYLVRVTRGAATLREHEVAVPAWTYAPAMQATDGPGPVEIAVAQLSDRFGPGPFRNLGVTV